MKRAFSPKARKSTDSADKRRLLFSEAETARANILIDALVDMKSMGVHQARTVRYFNIKTGAQYTGTNHYLLKKAMNERRKAVLAPTTMSTHPMVCTFKQAQDLGMRVKSGSKAISRVCYFTNIVSKTETYRDGSAVENAVPVWTPVFQVDSFNCATDEATAELEQRIRKLEMRMMRESAEGWLSQLLALYEDRFSKPASHVLALEKSRVEPLFLKTARALLASGKQYSSEELQRWVTPDLHPFLWPLVGIEACDTLVASLLSGSKPSLPVGTMISHIDRKDFGTSHAYYSHVFYYLSCVALFPPTEVAQWEPRAGIDVLTCVLSAFELCQSCGIPYTRSSSERLWNATIFLHQATVTREEKIETINKALKRGSLKAARAQVTE